MAPSLQWFIFLSMLSNYSRLVHSISPVGTPHPMNDTEAQLEDSCYEWVRRFGECHAKEKQYEDDDLDNPVWFGETIYLDECKEACNTEADARGRQCVAIEWKSEWDANYGRCNLAWACDEVPYYWTRNWVYRRYIYQNCRQFRKQVYGNFT